MAGSGSMYQPGPLLDHEVVLVTINFRLLMLGFLFTDTDEFSGNYGLRDQVLALEWVRDNIKQFGGDPNQVTIFGESAGGASVEYMMRTPLAKGLFHKAIVESGGVTCPWAMSALDEAKEFASILFKAMNCDSGDMAQVLACMRTKRFEDIVPVIKMTHRWDTDPVTVYIPADDSNRKNPVLPGEVFRHDYKMHGDDLPVMIGWTTNEGAFRPVTLFGHEALIKELNERLAELLPTIMRYYQLPEAKQQDMTRKIMARYFSEKFDFYKHYMAFSDMYGDLIIISGADNLITHRLRYSEKNTYTYLFNYRGQYSFSDFSPSMPKSIDMGVSHFDELFYLFALAPMARPDDLRMANQTSRLWANFAIYG